MTTANEILVQLEELWESAEPGPTREGDALIFRYGEGDFKIEPSADRPRDSMEHVRTLERAKPKPRVVMAGWVHDPGRREAYSLQDGGEWESLTYAVEADDLVDPVEMVEMPSREEILAVLEEAWGAWMRIGVALGGADGHRADAVLKLLKRR